VEDISMDIGIAVNQMKAGHKIARRGWNGKNMFLFLVEGDSALCQFHVGNAIVEAFEQPFVMMRTAQGSAVPWLCSQSDLLATDWEIVK
jgi:hypothetical protein